VSNGVGGVEWGRRCRRGMRGSRRCIHGGAGPQTRKAVYIKERRCTNKEGGVLRELNSVALTLHRLHAKWARDNNSFYIILADPIMCHASVALLTIQVIPMFVVRRSANAVIEAGDSRWSSNQVMTGPGAARVWRVGTVLSR